MWQDALGEPGEGGHRHGYVKGCAPGQAPMGPRQLTEVRVCLVSSFALAPVRNYCGKHVILEVN